MNQYLVKKAALKGEILVPSSKSHTLRAILFGSLANGTSTIHHYLCSKDTQAMVEACRLFGADIVITPDRMEIRGLNGKIEHLEDVINAGSSGIVLRFCSAIGALGKHPIVITGDYSIRHQRPMKVLLDGLSQLGVSVASMRGDHYAPVIIQGPMKPGKILVRGEDSQPISALLIASVFAEGPIEIHVENPGEKPWVALTLDWFDRLQIPYDHDDFRHYHLPGNIRYDGFEYHVPGDFSSAAFPLAGALITRSEITLKNIDINDSQGDKELIYTFQKMGACIEIDEYHKTVHVRKGDGLKGIRVDINNFVDAITVLAVVACFAEGETVIYNGAIAKQKECNRIHSIATELRKMGADITETQDGLCIRKSSLNGAQVHSYHDHRMAMSLSIAALGAQGETIISSVECVSKTFPTFMRDLNALGANIEEFS